jgi:hypothetical protein
VGDRVNPNQALLDQMLDKATRVEVAEPFADPETRRLVQRVVYTTDSQDDIEALRQTLRIIEDPSTFGHCMCIGSPWLVFYGRDGELAKISCHHGRSIRWDAAWAWDAVLKNGWELVEWLAGRGVTGLKAEVERMAKAAEIGRRNVQRWLQAMPVCLQPFIQGMMSGPGGYGMVTFSPKPDRKKPTKTPTYKVNKRIAPMVEALERAYSGNRQKVLDLFHWYGNGAGPWSGFPSYESYADDILAAYPTAELVAALLETDLSECQLEGAARFFAGKSFHKMEPKGAQVLLPDLRERLLRHTEQTGDEDKIDRAENAFDLV